MNDQNSHEQYREFYLPVRRRLPQKRQFHCRHCGASYPAEYAMDVCWPDRRYGSNRGVVVICKNCGCRQSLEQSSETSGGKEGSGGESGQGINWIPALILALMAAVTVVAVLMILPGRDKFGNGTGNGPSAVEVTGPEDNNPTANEDAGTPLIQPVKLWSIGNLFINISEGGLMQIVEDRVYYTNPEDDYRIYSMDLSFQDSRLECDIPSFYLNYRDNVLIFSGADGGEKNLLRMELDSGEVSMLSEQRTYEPKVVGDTIFYDDVDEQYSLYRCNLDGTDRRRISPGVVFYSCIVGNTIYYLDTQDDYHLYAMDLDGGNKRVILNQSVRELSNDEYTLYLSKQEGGIFGYDVNTGEMWQISDLSVSSLVAGLDGWLYFANLDREGCLYKMTYQGEELTKLSNEPVEFINVVSNLISFENKDTGKFYWMLTDGSHYQQVQ